MRWAAGLVLMVAVIALAVTFVNQVWDVVQPVAFAPAPKSVLPKASGDWIEIGGIDPRKAIALQRLLRTNGIDSSSEGSVMCSVYVPAAHASRAQELIAANPQLKEAFVAR